MTDKTITMIEDEPAAEPNDALENELDAESSALSDVDSLEALKQENTELSEQVKRTAAEFQNFRRRQEEEAKRVKVRLREDIVRTMLPILDNLERTLAAVGQGSDGAYEALLKGVELIEKDAKKIFGELGLEAIPSQGELFDPALHEAVMMHETDEVPDQTILQELQKGYLLGDRVLRPSMVQVARNS